MESNSYKDNNYRMLDKIPILTFVFIFDCDGFEKKYNGDFLSLFNSNIKKVCIVVCFLKYFYQQFCYFFRKGTNVGKFYHIFYHKSSLKKKAGKKPNPHSN